MKRHNSLLILSWQHHEVLLLAQLLKKGAPPYKGFPTDPGGKRNYLLAFSESELKEHFRKEEEILLPAVRGKNYEIDILCSEILKEHQQIFSLIEAIAALKDAQLLIEKMDELGRLLEAHIRKEERVLFEKIQQLIPQEELEKLEKQLS